MPASVAAAAFFITSISYPDFVMRPCSTMPKQSSSRPSVNVVWMLS